MDTCWVGAELRLLPGATEGGRAEHGGSQGYSMMSKASLSFNQLLSGICPGFQTLPGASLTLPTQLPSPLQRP